MFKKIWRDYKNLSNADGKWVTIFVLIYITFLLLDIVFPGSTSSSVLKYIGIFLCVAYAYSKHHRDTALTLAILFTFLSDTFLVWTSQELIGILCFCIAQSIHLYRFKKTNQKYLVISLLTAYSAMIFFYHGKSELLYIASMFYAMLLVTNFILSVKKARKTHSTVHDRFGFYGFTLFVCCDICVALRHIMMDGIISSTALPLINFLVWFFYFPAQALIASSSNLGPKPATKLKKSNVLK